MNVALLRKVQRHIFEEPKRVDMEDYCYGEPHDEGGPECGTVACIAGWSVMLSRSPKVAAARARARDLLARISSAKDRSQRDEANGELWDMDWGRLGQLVLGGARTLFFLDNWPKDLQRRIHRCRNGTKAYARVVSDAIDRYIAEPETFREND